MLTLITGGAGFIGSHLADSLLERGDEVAILDDFSSGYRENLETGVAAGAQVLEADIRDSDRIREAVASVKPDALVHLASQAEIHRSVEEPDIDASVNVIGTVNVISAALEAGIDRLVFASSGGAIYGEGSDISLPATESTVPRPLSPYGISKLAGEQYLDLYRRLYGLSSVALRLANIYGPRQKPKGDSGVIAILAERLRRGEQPIIFGDGSQTRDFVFVADVVRVFVSALDSDTQGAVNVGTGMETSLLTLVDHMEAAIQAGFDTASPAYNGQGPRFDPARQGEVRRIALDPSKAASELGWTATTPLETGLRLTLESI